MSESPRARVAVIGLGVMGAPMAVNLIKAGHDVVVFTRNPAGVQRLVALGAEGAASAAAAATGADVVVTMLPDGPDVLAVTTGDGGTFAVTRPGAVHIDCSTTAPQVSRDLAEAAGRQGIRFLDAPVSGGETGAVEGTLSIMVGGADDAFAAALPVLRAVGTSVVHVGPSGAGQVLKAANQLIVAGTIELVAEALVLVRAHGLDGARAVEVLAGGLAGSTVLARKAPPMLARDFTPGFRIDLHHKDLGIALATAREVDVVLPLGAQVAQLVGAVRAGGHGSLDHSALLLLVEELSGRTPSSPAAS